MEEESQSSPKSPDSPDIQTIVITPSELQKMGFAKELESVIEAQTHKTETEVIAPAKPVDDKQAVTIDPKTMKSKLCTLLNHTPLVMQVKDINWRPSERKSPILLNSVSKIPVMVQPVCLSPSPTDDPIIIEEAPLNETKPKLKIVSDEKLNISALEIENMLHRGKLLKSDEKISSPLQKLNAEEKLDLEVDKDKTVHKEPSTKSITSSTRSSINASSAIISEVVSTIDPVTASKKCPTVFSKVSCNALSMTSSTVTFAASSTVTSAASSTVTSAASSTVTSAAPSTIISAAPSAVTSTVSTNEPSKTAPTDDKVLKKECLKRIQAKLYENLKKVMEEVESRPIKDKASLSIKAVTSTTEEVLTLKKPVATSKPAAEKCKENKPCYMNKYRERKLSQEACETRKRDDDVIEIDSKPSSPASVIKDSIINIVDGSDTETIVIPTEPELHKEDTLQNELEKNEKKKIGRPCKKNTLQNELGKVYLRKEGRPRKQSSLQNELGKNNIETLKSPSKDTIQNELKKISVRKVGRPRKQSCLQNELEKNNIQKLESPGKEGTLKNELDKNDVKKEEQEPQAGGPLKKCIAKRFSESVKQSNVSSNENPTTSQEQKIPRKRGRPRKSDIKKIDEEAIKVEANLENGNETEKKCDSALNNESREIEENRTHTETPRPKRRGRPPKKRRTESTENVTRRLSKRKEEESAGDIKESTSRVDLQTECKIPKKRGRKSKAELEAMRRESEGRLSEIEMYTPSKSSGRKRKVINYSILNGDDSDVDEPEIKVKKVNVVTKKLSNSDTPVKRSDKAIKDEYGSSQRSKKERARINTDDGDTPSKKEIKSDELKDNVVKYDITTEEIRNDTQENEEKYIEPNATQVKCTICKCNIDGESWSEHKRKIHNDLAWNSSEEPLNLDDTTVVEEILNSVLKEEGVLKCSICENKSDSAEHFVQHKKNCNINLKLSANPGTSKRKYKNRKPGGSADVLDSLISNFTFKSVKLEENSENDSVELKNDQVQCAICMTVMSKMKWCFHKQNMHNNLAWRTFDQPLDLSDPALVTKILKDLCFRRKYLRCDVCGMDRKSVVGFLSHRSQCEKTVDEINVLKVKCHLCDRRMLPISLPRHMVLSHQSESLETTLNDCDNEVVASSSKGPAALGKRKAAYKAAQIIQNYTDDIPKKAQKYVKGVQFRSIDEVITKFNEDIQNLGHASCVFENCNYTATEAEDLFQHLETCVAKCGKEYTCNFCLATYQTRKSVRQHILAMHANETQENFIIHHMSSDEEEFQEYEEESNSESKFEELDASVPYLKVEKICYMKLHPKFLGPLIKKPVTQYYRNAYKWTFDYHKEKCSVRNIFPDIIPSRYSWKVLDNLKISNYLPKLKQSMDFTRIEVESITNPPSSKHNWVKYKLFQSSISSDGVTIIFCGGPVSAMSWAPTPYDLATEEQILAISVLPDSDKQYFLNSKYTNKGLIQFWNYGPLNNNTVPTDKPKLEFCIAHTYGVIWHMEWCPSGCYDSNDLDGLRKLGLLAVACSDSSVYIYTVIRPQQMLGKIFDVIPTFKLIMEDENDINLGEIPGQATKLSWTKGSGHSYLAVGYSNGIISIFKIHTDSGLLKKRVNGVYILKPILNFKGHGDAVTALVLYHLEDGKRWLVSGSLDKEVKLWDLKNVSEPINNVKKWIATDAVWSMHWHTAVFSFNHFMQASAVSSSLIPARNFNGGATPFVPSNSAITSLSNSDWGNLFIQANESGEVHCSFSDHLLYAFENEKRRGLRKSRFVTSYTACIAKNLTEEESEERENTKLTIIKQSNSSTKVVGDEPLTYAEAINSYGLVLCDVKMKKKADNPGQELRKLVRRAPYHSISKSDMYPIQSINKIVLNPNRQSFLFYACGYKVGLVRTSMLNLK